MRIIAAIIFLSSLILNVEAQISFPSQSDFKYLKGSNATELQAAWMLPEFDDNLWPSGRAPFWYGDGMGGTVLDDMQYNYSTVYLRTSFQCANVESLANVVFSVDYDDGFMIWINGQEVLKVNAPVSPLFSSLAPGMHESGSFEQFTLDSSDVKLSEGTNYLAVQGFNIGLNSTDFHFDLQLNARPNLPEYPDSLNIVFDQKSGFYEAPFHCSISTPDSAAQIIYTLDGSNPQNSITSFTYDSVASVYIDPGSTFGRAGTPAVILRVSLVKEGYKPAIPRSRTFIFLDEVKTQSHPGGEWPTGSINGQTIDLEVDSRIIEHPEYAAIIDESFTEISSISIITDLDNLFNPLTGIYVNARNDGAEWERQCAVELLNPDGSEGFGVNAGLRIRGGFSRAPEFAKHGFRLLFKKEYGDAKLHFPLFGNEGTDRFDNIDLRTSQNYSWANGDGRNTMVKEVFCRDSQRDLGQPYTRSRYYHLYLNGMYWGLYQTQERSEADYAADYFNGNSGDFDVVKVTGAPNYDIEATDGSLTSWQNVYTKTQIGYVNNKNYFELEGRDENGKYLQDATTWIDIDNLIDYMLTIFYTGNWDGPVSEPLSNKHPNNFYAIYSRQDKSEGYKFLNHDPEHSLLGAYDNRVNLADRTDGKAMRVYEFKEFHPQWLHHKLSENSEYRQRFADRAFMHLNHEGAFTPDKALKRFNYRASQIDTAIIAESARWGDGRGIAEPYTRNDNWLPELDKMREGYFPVRTAIVTGQLKLAGLYSDLDAPVVKENNIPVNAAYHKFEEFTSIKISNPNPLGVIYYTTSETDPREIGGGVSAGAELSEDENASILINSTNVLKARIYDKGNWGPLKQISFLKTKEDYSSLKVSELHYHPLDEVTGPDTAKGKNYEFIEFKNTGENALNLSGLILDSACYYEFPENEILGGGQFYVVSSKTTKFYERYEMKSSGNYSGYLSNAGEEILLHDTEGNTIIHFFYGDKDPWPELADGSGFSLVSADRNPVDDPDQPFYWTHSANIHGSPFSDEPYPEGNHLSRTESADVVIYPNPVRDVLNIVVNTEGQATKMNVEIYSITGIMLYNEVHPLKTSISLDQLNLETGIYIVKVIFNGFSGSYKLLH